MCNKLKGVLNLPANLKSRETRLSKCERAIENRFLMDIYGRKPRNGFYSGFYVWQPMATPGLYHVSAVLAPPDLKRGGGFVLPPDHTGLDIRVGTLRPPTIPGLRNPGPKAVRLHCLLYCSQRSFDRFFHAKLYGCSDIMKIIKLVAWPAQELVVGVLLGNDW